MERFKFFNFKETAVNYLVAILLITMSFFVPVEYFNENSFYETFGCFALFAGFIFCYNEYKKNRNFKHFYLTVGFILLLCIGRELNWGRVFFLDDAGNIIKRRDWVFGPYVYYVLAPAVLALIAYMYKTKFIQNTILLLKKAPIMVPDFALFALSLIIAQWTESSFVPSVLNPYIIGIEESSESVMYTAIAIIIYTYSRKGLIANIKDKR